MVINFHAGIEELLFAEPIRQRPLALPLGELSAEQAD